MKKLLPDPQSPNRPTDTGGVVWLEASTAANVRTSPRMLRFRHFAGLAEQERQRADRGREPDFLGFHRVEFERYGFRDRRFARQLPRE